MKSIITIVYFLGVFITYGQVLDKMAVGVDYTYRGRNAFGIGLEYRITDKQKPPINIAGRVLYATIAGKAKLIPELRFDYNPSYIFHLGTSMTPYAIEPRIGLNFLNMVIINTGYAISIDKKNYFRGMTFGFRINLALHKKFYDEFKIGF